MSAQSAGNEEPREPIDRTIDPEPPQPTGPPPSAEDPSPPAPSVNPASAPTIRPSETLDLTPDRDADGPPQAAPGAGDTGKVAQASIETASGSAESNSAAADAPPDGLAATIDPADSAAEEPAADGVAATIDPEKSASGVHATIDTTPPSVAATADPGRADSFGTVDFSLDSSVVKKNRRADKFADIDLPGYQIVKELGRGGMGVVYQARQLGLNRLVALKMILAGGHASTDQLARFHAEAEAVAQLQHPNIVQVYDVGEHKGLPFFSLEFVDGMPLDKELDGKPLKPERAAKIVETVARAMQFAHEHGIVHRDLKPENILMTRAGAPKVADFGLVKRIEGDSSQTRTGTIMGTPAYMAPEQGRGQKDVGPPADVYALGAVLYCLLTGRPPFLAATALDTLMQALEEEPVPPTRLQAKIPADLETVCLKALQKDPAKRYASADALADDIGRFLAGEPIEARPVGRVERVWRWCRRNPRLASLGAVAAVLAIVLMIGGPAAAVLIYQQKQSEQAAKEHAQEKEREAKAAEARAVSAKLAAERNERKAHAAEERAVAAKLVAEENERKAQAAKKTATQQSRLALDTIKKLVNNVQGELKNKPRMQDLRGKLFGIAETGLVRIAAEIPQSEVDVEMAKTRRDMGDMFLQIGRGDRAAEQYGARLTLIQDLEKQGKLRNANANFSLAVEDLGDTHHQIGNLPKAREYYAQCVDFRRKWVEEAKKKGVGPTLFAQRYLATGLGKLAMVVMLQGDLDAAVKYQQEALRLRQADVDANPDAIGPKEELAGVRAGLGSILTRLGKLKEAETYVTQSVELFEWLATNYQDRLDYRWNLALFRNRLGTVRMMAERPADAVDPYEQSVETLRELSLADPQNAEKRRHLAESQYGLGAAYLSLEDPRADALFKAALDLYVQLEKENAGSLTARKGKMLCLARQGKYVEAAKVAASLKARAEQNAHALFHVAAGYSLCFDAARRAAENPKSQDSEAKTRAATYAEQAVAALQAAIQQGYQVNHELRVDPDLQPMRRVPAYQALLEKHALAAR